MERILLWLLAAGALIGGIDCLFGNRLGLGERFEEGFRLLGPTALSMAGILCLSPLIVRVLSLTLSPLWQRIGLDPGMLGGFIPIDMGGYQAAVDLASDPTIGLYAGILVSATTGCTLAFTIPMGMGLLSLEDTSAFSRGILIGLIPMPAAQILGGLAGGMQFLSLLKESIPILLFSAALMLCLHFAPQKSLKVFGGFAKFLRALSLIGLTLGAVQYRQYKAAAFPDAAGRGNAGGRVHRDRHAGESPCGGASPAQPFPAVFCFGQKAAYG